MTGIFFLLRYAPFWTVPVMILTLEFAYIFWIKSKKAAFNICLGLFTTSLLVLAYYFWAGGPEKTVSHFIQNFLH